MSDMGSVTAVVVTWNSEGVIGECLRSLSESLAGLDAGIVIVDNASSDATVGMARQSCPDAMVMVNSENLGLPAANNQGMAARPADTYLIANPDVVFRPDTVRALLAAADRHAKAAWVAPRLVYEDGSLQTSVGSLPTLTETLLGRQAARRRAGGELSGFWWDGWAHDTERTIERCLECAYLVRSDAVQEVGPQDERYRLDWEGTDWCARFLAAGWEIWFTPSAVVTHLGGTSRQQVPYRAIISQHRGMYRYFADRRPRWKHPFLAASFVGRMLIKMLATVVGLPLYRWAHRDRMA